MFEGKPELTEKVNSDKFKVPLALFPCGVSYFHVALTVALDCNCAGVLPSMLAHLVSFPPEMKHIILFFMNIMYIWIWSISVFLRFGKIRSESCVGPGIDSSRLF